MAAKSIIIVFENGVIQKKYWTNLKECTHDLMLPYWSLSRIKGDINYKEFKILRLPKNK